MHFGTVDAEFSYLFIQGDFQAAELNETYSFLESRDQHWAFQTPDPNNANEYDHHIATVNLSQELTDNLRHKVVLGWFEKKHYRNDLNDGFLGYETSPINNLYFEGVTYNQGDRVPIYDDGTSEAYGDDHKNLMADYNLIWDTELDSLGDNTALFGAEYLYAEGGKWGKYGDLKADTDNFSLYVNDQILLLEETLVFSAGLRHDNHGVFGNETTGKIGTAYTFKDVGSTFFTNYGTSFKAPSFFNLYDSRYGNTDITPETGWTFEAGIRQDLFDNRLHGEITYWYSELDNVIVFDYSIPNPASSVGSGKYANRDAQETSGVEILVGYNFTDNLSLNANYTYTDSISEKDGESFRTVQIARHKGTVVLHYETMNYNFGVSGYYSGPRLRWKGDIEMEEYFRLDCFGRYNINDTLSIYGRIENLLDEDIEEGLGYEQPGVYAVAGIEFTL